MTVLGIDTSHHNALPDFAALARGGIGFILAKATEGVGFADAQYAASRAGAHAAGMIFGSYHFARPGDPVAQADYYLSVAQPRPGEICALDLEDTTIPDPVGFADAWCRRVKAATGAPPLLYLNSWFLTSYDWSRLLADGDALWLAKYDGQPTGGPSGVWPVVAVKQFTDRATVPGQPGPVDEDAFAGDLAALARYAIPGAPTPPQEDHMTPEQAAAAMAALAAIQTAVCDPKAGALVRVAALQGQVAALTTAVAQLSTGGPVDTAELAQAAQQAAQQAAHDALTALAAAITALPAAPAGS